MISAATMLLALMLLTVSSDPRLDRGTQQVQALWRPADGDSKGFIKDNFIADKKTLEAVFQRFEYNFEQLDGHFADIDRELRTPSELELGPLTPIDSLFAAWEPSAHMTEDLFANKLAFVALLNFPLTTLAERTKNGDTWSRRQWAEARLAARFSQRIPAEVSQELRSVGAANDLYIAEYNLWMYHVLAENGDRLFPKGKRLITHWNLRDELKANYADKDGLQKQRTIVKLMERIVTQTIPAIVIDNPQVDWNPFTNTVRPATDVEAQAPKKTASSNNAPEPNTRYERLLASFHAQQAEDPYSPTAKTAIDRAFDIGAEIPRQRIEAMFEEVLTSPLVERVASVIQTRVQRKLEPQDLWYNGFLPRGSIAETELDAKTRARYPNALAFAADIPRILSGLGFPAARAKYLADHIVVDPARGAGHALQSARRGDLPHLRTRIEPEGMNYKGYNIAVHELGHNVEQVFSLYDVDHTLLAGVPNTAFTEAIAFVFQAKDLELLGLGTPNPEQDRLRVLNDFWATWEIAGVGLVDIAVWQWMYDHPKATPAELRDATVAISKRVWAKYYAPVLGGTETPLLGIYSHMITYPLYLFNYPLGHLIAFQIEEQVHKAGAIGPELERMAKLGSIGPDVWMKQATGAPVSAGPLLRATQKALGK